MSTTQQETGIPTGTFQADTVHSSVALAAAELPEPEEGAAPPGAYTCC